MATTPRSDAVEAAKKLIAEVKAAAPNKEFSYISVVMTRESLELSFIRAMRILERLTL